MFTTKLTIELEIQTQFGPADAMQMVSNLLVPVPAVKSVRIVNASTDCDTTHSHKTDVNLLAIQSVPFGLK